MNFTITVQKTPTELGQVAAKKAAAVIQTAIAAQGIARVVLATGQSQFETLEALLTYDIDWSKVEVFHLDEYVGLPESHPASFRKYLKERFLSKVTVKAAHMVDGEGDVINHVANLSAKIHAAPIDLAFIGIGENAHIAFNDPPANFDTEEAFFVVELDDACKNQQVREGWFASLADVPKTAITMSVKQILAAKTIVSAVPHATKATAVFDSLTREITPEIPATILKTHPDWHLFLDEASASKLFRI